MMKTTTTKYVTKLIVAKPFTYDNYGGKTTIKAGRVLETRKNNKYHYYPWPHYIVMGHGIGEIVPVEFLKVKWFKETRTVNVATKEIKVTPKKA